MPTFRQFLDSFIGYEYNHGDEKVFNLLIRVFDEDDKIIKHFPACTMYKITYDIVKAYGDYPISWNVLEYAIEIRIHAKGYFDD